MKEIFCYHEDIITLYEEARHIVPHASPKYQGAHRTTLLPSTLVIKYFAFSKSKTKKKYLYKITEVP